MESLRQAQIQFLQKHIRDIPDFPKPGILFKDITPLLAHYEAFHQTIDLFAKHYRPMNVDKIIGIESRGFIFGAPLAERLGIGFIPVRKPGKLPHKTLSERYTLEYGEDTLEIHTEDVNSQERVVVMDDLLATGGTASATIRLLKKLELQIVGFGCLIELAALKGRDRLEDVDIFNLLTY